MKINLKIRFHRMLPLFILFCLLVISCGIFDPIDPYVNFKQWAASYGGSRDETLNSIVAGDVNSLYAAGRTETFGAGNGDAWLIKTSNTGTIEWQKSYNYDHFTSETFKRIQLSPDGTLTVLCNVTDKENQSFAIMNINGEGGVSWYHLYDGNKNETAEDCIKTPGTNDGYLITGSINSITTALDSSSINDAFLLAVDNQGNFRWQKIYGGSNYDEALVVLPSSGGGVYLAGNTTSFGQGKSDYWLVKTNVMGEVEWQKAFGGRDDEYLCTAAISSNNTVLLAGISTSTGVMTALLQRNFVYWLLCLNDKGNIVWQKTYHDPRDTSVFNKDITCSVHETTIQNRYIFTLSASPDEDGPDYCLLILNNDGSIKSQKRYGGSDSDHVKDVIYMPDHSCLAAGSTRSFGGGNKDFWFLKALPNLECAPLTKESGFVENTAAGEAVFTSAETRPFQSNLLEKSNNITWMITDTQCTVKTQAP